MNDQLSQCLSLLGVSRGASLEEINSAYFMLLKNMPDNPTEEQEEEQQQIMRAYAYVKRCYVPAAAPRRSGAAPGSRFLMPVAGGVMGVVAVALLVMNLGNLKVMMTRYEPGVMLRWKNQSEPYGRVVSYEPGHRFDKGDPFAAYQIHLASHDETVWMSEKLVVRGMVPVEGGEAQPAAAAPRN